MHAVLMSPDVNSEVVDDPLGEAHGHALWSMHSPHNISLANQVNRSSSSWTSVRSEFQRRLPQLSHTALLRAAILEASMWEQCWWEAKPLHSHLAALRRVPNLTS